MDPILKKQVGQLFHRYLSMYQSGVLEGNILALLKSLMSFLYVKIQENLLIKSDHLVAIFDTNATLT